MRRECTLFENEIFDSHTHCEGIDIYSYINGLHPTVQDVTTLSEQIKRSRIDCAIVFPIQSTMYYNPSCYTEMKDFEPSNLCAYAYEIENKRMLSGIQKFGYTHLLPFVSFSLNDKMHEQIEGMKEFIEKYEVYGLKYHTQTDRNKAGRINEFPKLISFLEENDLPIVFHTGTSDVADPNEVLDLAEKYPDIRMCVTHCARFRKKFFERYDPYK